MTPPRSSLLALAAALALSGGLLAMVEENAVHVWTCEDVLAEREKLGFLVVCTDGHDPPPDGWPPGAQAGPGSEPVRSMPD